MVKGGVSRLQGLYIIDISTSKKAKGLTKNIVFCAKPLIRLNDPIHENVQYMYYISKNLSLSTLQTLRANFLYHSVLPLHWAT
jgi:hypothetical protein